MSEAVLAPTLAQAVASCALARSGDAKLERSVERLAAAAGDSLVGLLFFGSRRTGAARVDAFSAYDVFAVVARYSPFYAALRRAGLIRRPAWLLALVSRVLPPTQISLRFGPEGVHLKASIIEERAFLRETGPARRDHFCSGRVFQPTLVLHARDTAARETLVACLVSALRGTWGWARPWLPAEFDAEGYGRSVLATSMRWELRPEPAGRAELLWQAQRALQLPLVEALIAELAARGELAAAGTPGHWRVARPTSALGRLRLGVYFRRSMARATARWLKHMLSFEGWLDYIVQKASRHSGRQIELSERERRFPLLFLWGRAARHIISARKGERKSG